VNLRIYSPRAEAINGKWNPLPVVKTQALPIVGQ
jgi:hypothetical protein